MSDQGSAAVKSVVSPDSDAITCEIEIAAPPERVFQALTRSDELMRWWGNDAWEVKVWEMDARAGGKWRMVSGPRQKPAAGPDRYETQGEILECVPPRLLIYSWLSSGHADPKHPTVVRWDLTPAGNATLVKVTHSGLAGEEAARKGYSSGWPMVVQHLQKFVEK